jgi:hypothetical protein
MKKLLLLLSLLILSCFQSQAQDSEECKITSLITGRGKNFQIIGDESGSFADSLFARLPETKRKGYIWKFKKVHVPGIDEPLTFQVHQGLHGINEIPPSDTTSYRGSMFFHTFTSEKYKQSLLDHKKPTDELAIVIYLRRGRNHAIKTNEEAALVKSYLLSIYESKS